MHPHRHHMGRQGHGGFWGRGVPGGRKLSSAELQLLILAQLEKAPAHGYEIIRACEETSGGFYVPSPGMVYPALSYLEEIGLASAELDGTRKCYSLTDAGRAQLEGERAAAESIAAALAQIGARMEGVREAFDGVEEVNPAAVELHNARRALKEALMSKRGCGAEEAQRITGILARATAEILSASPAKD